MKQITRYSVKLVRESNARYDAPNKISCAGDVATVCTEVLGMLDEPNEVLAVVLLDVKNKIIGVHEVSRGTLNCSLMHPREVLRAAILSNAYGMVLVHNHPSGDYNPSNADRAVTAKLKTACELMQIELLDHVIVSTEGYYSFRDSGTL